MVEIKRLMRAVGQEPYNDLETQRSLDEMCQVWKKDLDNNYDIVTLICGMEGLGKSTFAVLVARKLKEMYGFNYAFPKNYYEFLDYVENDEIKTIIVDESITELNLRRAMSENNVMYMELLTMCRSKKKIAMFLIPKIRLLDVYLKGDRVYNWIEIRTKDPVEKSGTALWFVRDMNNFISTESFDFRAIEEAIKKIRFLPIKDEKTEMLLRQELYLNCPNYIGYFKYYITDEVIEETNRYSEALKSEKIKDIKREYVLNVMDESVSNFHKKLNYAKLLNVVSKMKGVKFFANSDIEKIEEIAKLGLLSDVIKIDPQDVVKKYSKELGIDYSKLSKYKDFFQEKLNVD